MIIGAHAIVYSKDPEADRAFLRDVLAFPHVDAGDGWLVFRLPPAELAVHPSDENDRHELYLMTDDVDALVASLGARGVETSAVSQQGWGSLVHVTLPGGGKLGVYEPRHARPGGVARARGAEKRKASARSPRSPARKRHRSR